jgi:hypothetical protein
VSGDFPGDYYDRWKTLEEALPAPERREDLPGYDPDADRERREEDARDQD